MSHYARLNIQAQQKYEAELVAALGEHFGAAGVEVHDTAKGLKDWQGQSTKEKAEIIIRKDTLSQKLGRTVLANDLGYKRNNDEGYDVIADEAGFPKAHQDLVAQYYAEKVASKKLKAQGYAVARKVLSSGQIQLTAQRYG
jgi:hypothetical protein